MPSKTRFAANTLAACGAMLALCGCSSTPAPENTGTQSMRLQGSITSARKLDNARVVAIGTKGKRYWSYVDAAGRFTIALPPGASYRVLVTNAQRVGPDRVTAHLALAKATGASRWIGVHGSGTFDLGVLSAKGATTTIHTKSEKGEADHAEREDAETHEDDDDARACADHDGKDDVDDTSDDDDVELKAEHEPGDDRYHDDLEGEHEDDKEDDGEKDEACTGGGGGGGGGGAGGGAGGGGTSPAPRATAELGGACHVSADCAGALICAASTCAHAVIR